MSNTNNTPVTVDNDGPSAVRPVHVSDDWKLTAAPTVDGPSPVKINLALLPAAVSPETAARLHVANPAHVTESPDTVDYSDGYGHDYAVGE